MKKFLVFLVALIATVCIGVTFYQFAKNDEVISVTTLHIYINHGDKLSLDDIGFSRKEANKQTTFDFNAGGEDVTAIIKFDQATQCYIPTSKGGSTTIKIATSNRKYKTLSVNISVGVGSVENPYYISNEEQLFEITNKNIDKQVNYKLVNNINIKKVHDPIGLINGKYHEFAGTFDGGYNTIKNLQINSCQFGGLFGLIGSTATVKNLNITDAKLDGEYSYVGTVAGKSFGLIDKVMIENPDINNTAKDSFTGGVVGSLISDSTSFNSASIFRTGVHNSKEDLCIIANGTLGGLAGIASDSRIHACYTNVTLKNTSNKYTGGLTGEFIVDKASKIYESYTICNIDSKGPSGNISGEIRVDTTSSVDSIDKSLVLVGLYFNSEINEYTAFARDNWEFEGATHYTVNGKDTKQLKLKTTYVYYMSNDTNVYWDNVWHCVDGQYPSLIFANQFTDVDIKDDSTVTTPDIEEPGDVGDVTDPNNPSSETVPISTKEELIRYFQTGAKVKGVYVINSDIDLDGYTWKPVEFSGKINGNNHTIRNFIISQHNDKTDYRGIFYRLSYSTIKNIKFCDISFSRVSLPADCVGAVAGYVGADVLLKNITVADSSITIDSVYSGGVVGAINSIAKLQNITTSGIVVSAQNAGGIAGRISESAILSSCNVTNSSSVRGIDLTGGIVADNCGTVDGCSVEGNITTYEVSKYGYIGGIAAMNSNVIKNSTCWASIEATNASSVVYQVGGIAGVNYGTISYSSNNSPKIDAKNSTSKTYIGGITSTNQGKITYCVVDVFNGIGSINDHLRVAGLVTLNYGGEILGCFSFGNLSGYIVAGLVAFNEDGGTVSESMAGKSINDGIVVPEAGSIDRAKYQGTIVTTFAYSISSGSISDCLVSASLECQSSSGWIAGFAGFMDHTTDNFGTIEHCIANISMANSSVGLKFADIATCDLMTKKRSTGTITECIITDELAGAKQSQRDKKWFSSNTHNPGSGSNYAIKSVSDMLQLATYREAGACHFDIADIYYLDVFDEEFGSVWVKLDSRIPVPSSIFKVYGNDVFGYNFEGAPEGLPGGDTFDDSSFVDKWIGDAFTRN